MGLFQQKLSEGNVLSWHDGRSGSLRDWADANDGTPGGNVLLNREGFVFDGASGDIDCGSDFIGTSACTVITKVNADSAGEGTFGRIISNGKLAFFINATAFSLRGDGSTTANSATISFGTGETFVAVSRDATGANTNFYINGVQSGTANQDSGTPEGGSFPNVTIGNTNSDNRTFDGTIHWIAIFNEVLTNSEINEISAELDAMKWPSKVTGKAIANVGANPSESGLIGAWDMKPQDNQVIDGSSNGLDLTLGAGVAHEKTLLGDALNFGGDSFAKSTNSLNLGTNDFTFSSWVKHDGTAGQATILYREASGGGYIAYYRIDTTAGYARAVLSGAGATVTNIYGPSNKDLRDNLLHHIVLVSDKSGNATLYVDNVAGTPIDISSVGDFGTATVSIGGHGVIASPSEVFNGLIVSSQVYSEAKDADWVAKEYARGANAVQFKTDFGAKESVANETAGFLSNTPFEIQSGTWKVSSDTIDGEEVKVIECVAAGFISAPTSVMGMSEAEAAYGTWEMYASKAAASNINVMLVADVNGIGNATGQDGYYLLLNGEERIAILESINGTPVNRFVSDVDELSTGTFHKYRVTRSAVGVFTVYRNDVIVGNAVIGANPFTNTTSTVSNYFVIDMDAGDKIAISDRTGNRSIVKKLGV